MAVSAARKHWEPQRGIYFSQTGHGEMIIAKLCEQKNTNFLCDIQIAVADQTFHAHRCVLALWSEYFSKRLINSTSADSRRTELDIGKDISKRISSQTFSELLIFMYSGRIEVSVESRARIKKSSEFLKIQALHDHCSIVGVCDQSYGLGARLLSTTRLHRKHAELCDVTLRIAGKRYHTHRSILAACSPYFEAMFTHNMAERNQSVIDLPCLTEDQGRFFLTYVYNGGITISSENIDDGVVIADFLGMLKLKQYCSKFMEQTLEPSNCIGYLGLAKDYDFPNFQCFAWDYLKRYFYEVIHHDEIMCISVNNLLDLINNDEIVVERICDGKPLTTELSVFKLVVKWTQADLDERQINFPKLFASIRLSMISPSILKDTVLNCELVKEFPECTEMATNQLQSNATVVKDTNARRGKTEEVVTMLCATSLDKSADLCCFVKQRWVKMPQMIKSLSLTAMVVHNGILYAAGGFADETAKTTKPSTLFCAYNPLLNKWTQLPDLIEAGGGGTLLADGNILVFLVDGRHQNRRQDYFFMYQVQVFNTMTQKWSLTAALNVPLLGRFALTNSSLDGFCLISWSRLTSQIITHRYHFNCAKWESWRCPDKQLVSGHKYHIVTLKEQPYLFYFTDFNSVHYLYDLDRLQWYEACYLNIQVHNSDSIASFFICDDKIYLFGRHIYSMNLKTSKFLNQSPVPPGCPSIGRLGGEYCVLQVPNQFTQEVKRMDNYP
uniref:Kelch-like protein 12-like n=1 Tax=Saccoglossus kowalevskii TaxID=10224 RepID=A0ABM0LUA2_SACKO|nr:PREDICTED: kelch-like protein 12-like [Saccoglossus kowalevskii]